jgi:hypothetical protein
LVIAAKRELELMLARRVIARADAARAQDAALGVEHDVRADVDDLSGTFGVSTRESALFIEVQLLQRAPPALSQIGKSIG